MLRYSIVYVDVIGRGTNTISVVTGNIGRYVSHVHAQDRIEYDSAAGGEKRCEQKWYRA